jgi:hypothetical protein
MYAVMFFYIRDTGRIAALDGVTGNGGVEKAFL